MYKKYRIFYKENGINKTRIVYADSLTDLKYRYRKCEIIHIQFLEEIENEEEDEEEDEED